jgi:hypothetical protein
MNPFSAILFLMALHTSGPAQPSSEPEIAVPQPAYVETVAKPEIDKSAVHFVDPRTVEEVPVKSSTPEAVEVLQKIGP